MHPNTDVNAQANLHQVCDKCLYIARNSQLLQHDSVSPPHGALSETFTHHETIKALESAMQQGCHLCTLITGSIQDRLMHAVRRAEHERAARDQEELLYPGVSEPIYKIEISGRAEIRKLVLSLWVIFDETVNKLPDVNAFCWLNIERYAGLST